MSFPVLASPASIGQVLQLNPLPQTDEELDEMVRAGLPKRALRASVQDLFHDAKTRRHWMNELVPEATFKRRTRLNAEESEKIARLARVQASALHVWSSERDAQAFLQAPHPDLGERAPLEVAKTELGARRVEALLWSIFHGLPV
jgi:putative toxin-antitoxin system antitoxin component (TIGR02293 family)